MNEETIKRLRASSISDNMRPITLRVSRVMEKELRTFCQHHDVRLAVVLREIVERGWKDLVREQDPS